MSYETPTPMSLGSIAHALSSDLPTALSSARQAELAGVVIDPVVFPDIVHASQTGLREILHLFSRFEQRVIGVDVRLAMGGLSPDARNADLEREIDRMDRAMQVARILRSPLVLCDLGPLPPAPMETASVPSISPAQLGKLILPEPAAAAPVRSLPRDLPFETNVETALREVGMRADRLGVMVAFRATLGSFASLQAALRRVECPWFGVDLDPLAMLADEWSADAVFSALGSRLLHVRARDGTKGSGNRVAPAEIGQGQIDWAELSSLCRDADFRGAVSIDAIDLPDRRASTLRGATWLRTQIKR
jgi:sugar phosphate isomerase/epimerase